MPRPRHWISPDPHRQQRVAEHEAGNDVGAAGDGGEQGIVCLDVAVDVIETLRAESGEPVEKMARAWPLRSWVCAWLEFKP
jgi:hypothetical protein